MPIQMGKVGGRYMADNTVKIGGETVEQVAYKLLLMVGEAEKKLYSGGGIQGQVDRKWILDTYHECLVAARGHRE